MWGRGRKTAEGNGGENEKMGEVKEEGQKEVGLKMPPGVWRVGQQFDYVLLMQRTQVQIQCPTLTPESMWYTYTHSGTHLHINKTFFNSKFLKKKNFR